MSSKVQRKLTTIFAADAVAYSHAMNVDEVSAFDSLRSARNVFKKFIERHDGRIANTAGDGLIAEFPSVVEAVQCAIEVQQELVFQEKNGKDALRFRIGIHLGDVMIDGSDLLGDAVNLAARLESMAEPGGVLISQQVYDQVQHKLSIGFEYLGEKRPKNFIEDVPVYGISLSKKRSQIFSKRQAKATNPSRSARTKTDNLRDRIRGRTKLLLGIWLALLVVDLTTGSPFWAHWPGLGIGVLVALHASPMFVNDWFQLQTVRLGIIVSALTLINVFTWTGYPWVMWPAGALVTLELIRRLLARF
ncbi:MAG: adenylate/guanylate cyclase domain-containing protein [Granulosicoccus sp.]